MADRGWLRRGGRNGASGALAGQSLIEVYAAAAYPIEVMPPPISDSELTTASSASPVANGRVSWTCTKCGASNAPIRHACIWCGAALKRADRTPSKGS